MGIVGDAEIPQSESAMPQDEPTAVEEVPQEEPAQKAQDDAHEFDVVRERLHQARTRQDLMQIWVSMDNEMKSNQALRDAFQQRQADISLAAAEGAGS